MGAIWLLSLPDVLRGAGLEVDTYPGWELRARSSGGYDSLMGIQVHHTASDATPASDMSWMWEGSPDEPIGACHLARSGTWTVGAAGATNTSGKGGPLTTSKGVVPVDAGNRYLLSVEAANDGVGEPWPNVQIDSYLRGVTALCDSYGLTYMDAAAHFEWTDRKIDPAGPSPYATGANSWDMNAFRSDLGLDVPPPRPPQPPTTGDLMYTFLDLTDVDAVLGGYMDANGICAVAEWLTPARYAAMVPLGVPTVEIPSAWCTNITLLGPVPGGMTPGHFANVIP